MKMNLLKILLGVFLFIGSLNAWAQNPEVFPLWPQGPKEENGLKGKESVKDNGSIANNNVAELMVYHPDPAKKKGIAVLICPGGGYTHLAMNHEGDMFAKWLTERGITAIVLKYRMPNRHSKIPMADAQRAMRWVRSRAEELNIEPSKVGIAGFSAGGHLASTLSTHFDTGKLKSTDRIEGFSCRPDFTLLFYPVISMKNGLTHAGSRNSLIGKTPSEELIKEYSNELQVTARTPPAFIVHSDDDAAVPSLNSVAYYQALKKNKVPAVFYIFPKGGHGWGLRESFEYYPMWTKLLEKWLGQL